MMSGSCDCVVVEVEGVLESPEVVVVTAGSPNGCSGLEADCLDKLAARSASFASEEVNTRGRQVDIAPHIQSS